MVQSLGWEDPLKKGLATHSSIFAWEILQTEEPGRLQSMGSQRVGHDLATRQQPQEMIEHGWATCTQSVLCVGLRIMHKDPRKKESI